MEEFLKARQYVPNVNATLFDECAKKSLSTRMQIIINQRAAILILQMQKHILPNDLVPLGDDTNTGIIPQQIQFITVLIDFIHQNPQILAECLMKRFDDSDKSNFIFLCNSAIPAFFGFFSSLEHIQLAFPFYTLLLSKASLVICEQALIPFYCNSCTYKFIESVFDIFGYKLCNDVRVKTKNPSVAVFEEYLSLCIKSIVTSYPLLPRQHQFLLKYMKTQGWTIDQILHFFLHCFVLPQLLRYLYSTPYINHYNMFVSIARALKVKSKYCKPLEDLFGDNSIYEIPPIFNVFGLPYVQLLMARSDVDAILRAMKAINKMPTSMKPFIEHNYFSVIDNRPFFVKVYSRKPRPVDASYNWRRVVFEDKKINMENEGVDDKFNRLWNQVEAQSEEYCKDPIAFLTEEPKTPQEYAMINTINTLLGDEKGEFLEYGARVSLKQLNAKTAAFENYLVHSLALKTIEGWLSIVNDDLNMMVVPFAEQSINEHLSRVYLKQLVKNQPLIDAILESAASKIDMPIIRQFQYLVLVQNLLPLMIGPRTMADMRSIENRWQKHIETIRTNIVLPHIFTNRNKNKNQALILNQKLWQVVGLFGSVSSVQFSSVFLVFIQAIKHVLELETACYSNSNKFRDENDILVQFAIAFSDCPIIITKFILINALLVKQDRFKFMSDTDAYLILWCKLESSILKLLSSNPELMNTILSFQEMLIEAKLV